MNIGELGRVAGYGVAILVLGLAVVATAIAAVGDLDSQFGQGGQVEVAGNAGPNVLELSDGRILVVGKLSSSQNASAPSREVAINRYLASGAPDASFGTNGQVVVTLPVDSPMISATALQPDGHVIMAGSYWAGGGQPFVARVDSNGTLDHSFGSDGISEPGTGATEPFYSSLVVLSNGEILAAISDWTSDRLDRFAADGRSLGNWWPDIAPARIALQSDGRLVVSGYHRTLKKSVVMRVDANGQLDPTFGQDGFAELESGYTGNLSVEPGGDRIVLCGPGVVRLTSDGHPDTTFGLHGTGYVAFGSDGVPMFDYCNRIVTPRGGGVVYIGIREGQGVGGFDVPFFDQVFIAGLTANGTSDTRFGAGTVASEVKIGLGLVKGSRDWWQDYTSSFVVTRDGNALLTWLTASEAGLVLARIDLGGTGTIGVVPPAPPPPAVPAPTPTPPTSSAPTPSPTASSGDGHGGGGALTWFELTLCGSGLACVAHRRRRIAATQSAVPTVVVTSRRGALGPATTVGPRRVGAESQLSCEARAGIRARPREMHQALRAGPRPRTRIPSGYLRSRERVKRVPSGRARRRYSGRSRTRTNGPYRRTREHRERSRQ